LYFDEIEDGIIRTHISYGTDDNDDAVRLIGLPGFRKIAIAMHRTICAIAPDSQSEACSAYGLWEMGHRDHI
jgi:hypothetical protein